MSIAEIIAELPRLSDPELAQVQAKLFELVLHKRKTAGPFRIESPRLANPEQAKLFAKQVLDLPPDAKL